MVSSGGKQYFYRNMDTRDSSVGAGRDVLYGQSRSTEFTALISWSSLSLTEETNIENTDSTTSSVSSLSVGFSFERYFPEDDGIWRRISLLAFLDLSNATSESDNANVEDTSTSKTTFGGGLNYHFSDPYKFEHMIFFISGKLGYVKADASTGGIDTTGTGLQMSGGIGIKFYTLSGFGMRLLLDLHSESVKTTNSSDDTETTITSTGPKIYAGMSYRF